MKKKVILIPFFLLGMLGVLTFSCDKDPLETCTDFSACGETAEACCTVSNCHYEYNGSDYDCDGTDCTSAASDLVADMCSKSAGLKDASIEEVVDRTDLLLEKVRQSSSTE